MNVLLEARGLEVRRGKRSVLRGVSVQLRAGEALALVGPNAAGKSTLIQALAGLLPVAAGDILLQGRALQGWARDAAARTVALVAAEEPGGELLTVRERVMLGRYPHRGPFRRMGADDESAVALALRETGIVALAQRRLNALSAGERQLASLARGLAQEPRLLLLDEPSAHLDVGHQWQLFRVLDAVRARGVAVLAVIHDLQRAADWAERVILLAQGAVVAEGSPSAVFGSAACAQAFGVVVRRHEVAGRPQPLYSFEPGA
jgi:ABC-type cobalamin/Fe3+-siderophores transport system ATPase subunit